jgi:hypothetical protein
LSKNARRAKLTTPESYQQIDRTTGNRTIILNYFDIPMPIACARTCVNAASEAIASDPSNPLSMLDSPVLRHRLPPGFISRPSSNHLFKIAHARPSLMVKIDQTQAYLNDYVASSPDEPIYRRSLVWHQREFRFPPAKLPLFARLALPPGSERRFI